MIREIIQFTKDLLEDIPDIMNWNNIPEAGLYVFIDIDEQGNWTNKDLQFGVDYTYTNGEDDKFPLSNECKLYNEACKRIGTSLNKCFDLPAKKIHSCSPFAVAYRFNNSTPAFESLKLKLEKNSSEDDIKHYYEKLRNCFYAVVKESLPIYFANAIKKYPDIGDYKKQVDAFRNNFDLIITTISNLAEYRECSLLTSADDYLKVFIRTVPIKEQAKLHDSYYETEILNGDMLEANGVVGFFTAYDSKKTFLRHLTAYMKGGTNYRYTTADALLLEKFQTLMKRKPSVLPKLLPIVVDKRELNKDIVKIFNDNEKPLTYREIIKSLFEKHRDMNYLQDFYLASFTRKKDLVINDIDFVPLFRYRIDNCKIKNVMRVGYVNDNKEFEEEPDTIIADIFDFERLVVSPIFNNSLVVVKQDEYFTKYWDEINSIKQENGGYDMHQLIIKYRKAIYDYIYKSKVSAISDSMFEDMMFKSIFSDIKHDKVANPKRFSNNYKIKNKLNIWFSIDYLFNNNNIDMASKIKELNKKMLDIAIGNTIIDNDEEFAFAAGQLVSYLIDRSASSEKTYSLLEPYLQKSKSGMLQDALAQTIAVYKHDISTYKGKFQSIASQVLTFDTDVTMKPLLKYFLAGCFADCVIYQKTNDNNNNNE